MSDYNTACSCSNCEPPQVKELTESADDLIFRMRELGKELLHSLPPDRKKNIKVETFKAAKRVEHGPEPVTDVQVAFSQAEANELNSFSFVASQVAKLVTEKNKAYGASFEKSGEILKILYPNGVSTWDYTGFLAVTRVIDKLFRIATDRDALSEDPWSDICGYSLLSIVTRSKQKT